MHMWFYMLRWYFSDKNANFCGEKLRLILGRQMSELYLLKQDRMIRVSFAAQRYGLVDAPPRLLSEDEWKSVKEKAKIRRDFQEPCVICKEDLGLQQHVSLLHISCLGWPSLLFPREIVKYCDQCACLSLSICLFVCLLAYLKKTRRISPTFLYI